MDIIFKINKFLLSDKYRYVDILIGMLFLAYSFCAYMNYGDIKYIHLISGIIILILGITDFTRKSLRGFMKSFIREVD